jgi:SPP1 family predicted phage head-tail adaptor
MPDRVSTGKMDRYITAQVKTESKSAKGQVIATWVDVFSFFASQDDAVVRESLSAIATIAPVSTSFSTHYRSDITRQMRLKCEGEIWMITSIIRDRFYMKIDCQRMDD